MVNELMRLIAEHDSEVGAAVNAEFARQRRNLELIASENIVSEAVMAAMGTVLTNKYAEGYPGKRYYGGCQCVDVVEDLARDRACRLFGADHANVQPHSGAQANLAAYFSLLQPGDTVLGMDLSNGGHLTHGSPVNFSGKNYHMISYGLGADGRIDYDQVRDMAKQHKPKMIIAGASAYPRVIDFAKFREVADAVGAYLMVDMAHIAGLVAAGLHMSPIPYAHVTTSTTHKTLRGPRGGLILSDAEFAREHKLNRAVFPGVQGGPLMHVVAAKAVAFKEVLDPGFKAYQQLILDNCKALAQGLMSRGFDLVSGGTDNHLMLVDLRGKGITGKDCEHLLDSANITCNKNAIPDDPASPNVTSGIRLGTAAVSARGFQPEDMGVIAACIDDLVAHGSGAAERVRAEVARLTAAHPLYKGC